MCSAYLSVDEEKGSRKGPVLTPKVKVKTVVALLILVAFSASLYWVLQPQPLPKNVSKYVGRGTLYDHLPDQKVVYDAPHDLHKYDKWQDNRHFYSTLDLLIRSEVANQLSLSGTEQPNRPGVIYLTGKTDPAQPAR
jgi:hypothetical protein